MARGKVLAICQSGGEFVIGRDGSMSYSGGEAHAVEVTSDMKLNDFKAEISCMFNCRADTFIIKYFLPSNRKTLITISNDKDLQRMVDFSASSNTTDVYILKKVEHRYLSGAFIICFVLYPIVVIILLTLEECSKFTHKDHFAGQVEVWLLIQELLQMPLLPPLLQ